MSATLSTRSQFAGTFEVNVLWNMASLAFLAFAGLLLNIIIGRYYGPAALGLFNVVFALYIFLSQIGVLGIHFSVLRYVSEHARHEPSVAGASVAGAVALVAMVSASATGLALLATPLVVRVYPFDGMPVAWLVMLPGLFCFSLNKVLLAAMNGAERMRAFACLQALRYVLVLLALWGFVASGAPAYWLIGVITIGEALLLPVLAIVVVRTFRPWSARAMVEWMRKHLDFGMRVFLSGTIGELNTRVDVLLIGTMLDSTRAGVYSVALLLAEGLAQAVVVLRNNLNPIITQHLTTGATAELQAFARRISGWFAVLMAAAGAGLVLAFAIAVTWLLPDDSFAQAILPLAILAAGLVVASPYLPFGMMLSQTGRPAQQTLFAGAVLVCNVGLNIILIPLFGINGAALGTSISYVVTAILLIAVMRRQFGMRLWI